MGQQVEITGFRCDDRRHRPLFRADRRIEAWPEFATLRPAAASALRQNRQKHRNMDERRKSRFSGNEQVGIDRVPNWSLFRWMVTKDELLVSYLVCKRLVYNASLRDDVVLVSQSSRSVRCLHTHYGAPRRMFACKARMY